MAKMRDVCVALYASREGYDADVVMDTTVYELAEACHSGNCPMGLFSCPLHDRCGEVTEETWADFFHIKKDVFNE